MRYLGSGSNPFDVAIKQDIPEIKRQPPTGLRLERKVPIWTIWFDQGSGLQFPSTPMGIRAYGTRQPMAITNEPSGNAKALVLQSIWGIIPYVTGFVGKNDLFGVWHPDVRVINPVNDRNDYDFSNCYMNKDDTNPVSRENQRNCARALWELGIWTDEELSYFGAVRKK